MLLFPEFKLFRGRCFDSGLNLFNLISIVGVVVQNLPLLGRSLVELDLFGLNLFGTNDIFNPELQLAEELSIFGVVEETSGSTITPLHLHLVVLVLKIVDIGSVVSFQDVKHVGGVIKLSPQLFEGVLRVQGFVISNDF